MSNHPQWIGPQTQTINPFIFKTANWWQCKEFLERALRRWAHDEDLVAWLRRTLCEMGAGHCN